MYIPTYEVNEENRRVECWESLLAEYNKKAEKELPKKSDRVIQLTQ